MFCLADVSCIAKRCLFVVYILLFEGGLEGVERIGAFEECAADDMVGGRQRDGEFVFLRIEFGVLDVREPERLVGYGAFFHHGNRDQVAVDGDFPALSDEVNSELDLKWSEMKSYDEGDSYLFLLLLLAMLALACFNIWRKVRRKTRNQY